MTLSKFSTFLTMSENFRLRKALKTLMFTVIKKYKNQLIIHTDKQGAKTNRELTHLKNGWLSVFI